MFLVSLVLACLTGAMWTIYRVIGQSSRSLIQKIFIGLFVVAAWFVPVTIKNRGPYEGILYTLFYHIAYFAFVVALIFFCLMIVRDLIWGVLWLIEKKRLKKQQPAFVESTDTDSSSDDLMIVDESLSFNTPFELPAEGIQKTTSFASLSAENALSSSQELQENIQEYDLDDDKNFSSEIDIYDEDVLPDELKPQIQEDALPQEPVKTTSFAWKQPSFLAKTNRFLFVAAVAMSVYGLYEGLKTPVVKETVIQTNRLEKPLTVVSLSDLHLHRTLQQGKINQIVKTVNQLKPDLIVLPGDTIDDEPRRIQGLMGALKKLKAPLGVYATAGNHEFYVNHEKSKKALESVGVNYLFNQGVDLKNNVYLAGVPDARSVRLISDYVDVQKALNSASDKEYKILLSHTPTLVNYLQDQKVDLQISGHTHGGQIFPFHLFSWMLNGGYLAGLYDLPNSKLYVSRGSGQWGPQIRLLAPSEISVIKIVPQSQEGADSNKKTLAAKEDVSSKSETKATEKEQVVDNQKQPATPAEKKEVQAQPLIDKSPDKPIEKAVDMKENVVASVVAVQETQLVQDKMDALQDSEKKIESDVQPKETPKSITAEINAQNNDKKEVTTAQVPVSAKPIDAAQKAVVDNIIALKSQADKEAQTAEEKAFEEAKAQMDAEFEKVLVGQKALEQKKAETEKLVAQNETVLAQKSAEEQSVLRAELEAAKAEAQKALESQKKALEAVEAEKKTAQVALDAQKKLEQQLALVQKELAAQKADQEAMQKEQLIQSAKKVAETAVKAPVKKAGKKVAQSTKASAAKAKKADSIVKAKQVATAQKASKPSVVVAGIPTKGITPAHKPSKITAATSKVPVRAEQKKRVPVQVSNVLPANTVQKQIDPNAIMTITKHPDGSVTRTIVRTTVQETATQVKTLKTVTSYTSTAAEENARNGKGVKGMPAVVIQQQPISEKGKVISAPKSGVPVVKPVQQPMIMNRATSSISTVPASLEKALMEPKLPTGLQVY